MFQTTNQYIYIYIPYAYYLGKHGSTKFNTSLPDVLKPWRVVSEPGFIDIKWSQVVSKEIVQDVPKAIQFGPHLGDDFIIIGTCIYNYVYIYMYL